jgi:bacillithiol biosynthesis cysteine-adding enzyme BshC
MPNDCISYQKSGYFTKLMIDYLDEKPQLKQFYNHFPTIENFKKQIEEKQQNFSFKIRQILVTELEKQYSKFEISESTLKNIQLLNNSNTFTITTGHQLNLFTGPLYFLYKIVSVINLCKELKLTYPEYNFVPIYWMATEDHDFEEINYFNFKNKKIRWKKDSFGPVGRLLTADLKDIFTIIDTEFGTGNNVNYLKEVFKKSYLENQNLADATRSLANELFKNEGLVIIDGDSKILKTIFIPYVKKELLEENSFKKVTETNTLLNDYFIQVNPREINLFYIEDNLRERIIKENEVYKVNNTSIEFSENEILNELENHPEKFSPNVILRPLYQEVILPNLCYIGGGGELAYWLELKSNFEANNITFPILLLRNSVLLATEKQAEKADKLNLTWADLFSNQQELFDKKTKEFSEFTIDFAEQKEHLKKQFKNLYQIANQTDKSFFGAVKAQEAKQIEGLENLEKRLLKAEKRVHADKLQRILLLQNELFPNQILQERKANFSEFYLEFGSSLIEELLKEFNPLSQEFKIITLK